ncbi:MAG TPA: galactose-1-phosphate uridylyltransferase [Streptosporangiaceae bacterium]|nr:galactose-1-phosphate uridylyltransferase [Streptosporangiaceae bacterium]
MRKKTITLADGRLLTYYGDVPATYYPDRRDLARPDASSQLRYDHLLGEWVIIASHRQERTFRPADDQCPLCPSTPRRLTEIPAPRYEVAVFENRFPALSGGPGDAGDPGPAGTALPLLAARPAAGRCEVICFSSDHETSFASLPPAHVAIVMAAWIDRSAALAQVPGIEQVYCFENRGKDIGATLSHPHGQIYAYPYVGPRTARMLHASGAYRRVRGRNLFDDLVQAERDNAERIVADGSHWTAFVPFAARWPYEVHLYPRHRVADLAALPAAAKAEFCELYPDLLRRFDRLFDSPAPYISGWHQAPVRQVLAGTSEFALHLELFTMRRASGKLKYLAGSESGMGAFANDVLPEEAARRLRDLA